MKLRVWPTWTNPRKGLGDRLSSPANRINLGLQKLSDLGRVRRGKGAPGGKHC